MDQNKNINNEEFNLNYLSINDLKDLDNKYLGINLKEKINEELNKKLCLYIS